MIAGNSILVATIFYSYNVKYVVLQCKTYIAKPQDFQLTTTTNVLSIMHELTCHVHTTQQKRNLFRGHVKDEINRHLLYIVIKSHHVVKWTEIRLYLLKIYCDKGVNSTQHLILKLIITTCKQKRSKKNKKPNKNKTPPQSFKYNTSFLFCFFLKMVIKKKKANKQTAKDMLLLCD